MFPNFSPRELNQPSAESEELFSCKDMETVTESLTSRSEKFELSVKRLVGLHDMYARDGKERNIENFIKWMDRATQSS